MLLNILKYVNSRFPKILKKPVFIELSRWFSVLLYEVQTHFWNPNYCRKIVEKRIFVSELLSKIMATLSLTILPAKALKEGKHKVRIAVAHNSTTRYIVTDVIIDSEKEWKNGRVVKRPDANFLNTCLAQKLQETRQAIDSLPYIEGLSCAELIDAMRRASGDKHKSLKDAFEEMIGVSTVKESTKSNYKWQFAVISRYIPPSTPASAVTPLMVNRLKAEMMRKFSNGHVIACMTQLTSILRYCQRNGYAEFTVLPTEGVKKPAPEVRQSWLTPDQVRCIRDSAHSKRAVTLFRDLFMLSYYLGGINLIDLSKINFRECDGHIKYVRTKTDRRPKVNQFVEFDIPKEANEIISRMMGDDGKLKLWDINSESMCHYIHYYTIVTRKNLCLPGLTYYSARKSFAQHAFNLGISESVIDYILGHSLGNSKSCLYSYIKVTPAMATAAIRKVCDFIAGNENFD